jgi:hypothetical protein
MCMPVCTLVGVCTWGMNVLGVKVCADTGVYVNIKIQVRLKEIFSNPKAKTK